MNRKFARIIDQHIEQIKNDIQNLKDLVKPVQPDNAIGRLSRMEALNEQAVNKSNLEKAQKRLEQLEIAQKRVKTDDYGLCLRCDEVIAEKRLEVLPESQICMSCFRKTSDS